jgi:phytoene dehydrogenase-like protein
MSINTPLTGTSKSIEQLLAGRTVLVLERNDWIGGATTSKRVFPDYEAWLSSYSYLVSLFPDKIRRDLGLDFVCRRRSTASFTPYMDTSGIHRGLVISNEDAQRSRASMLELTGSEHSWTQYQSFLGLEQALAARVWPSLLEPIQSRQHFVSNLQGPLEKEAWDAFVERPLGEAIERYATHDVLRGLLMTDGKIGVFTHPHDSSLLQNRCFLYHVIGNGTGEWQVPVGGMQSLVNSLLLRCKQKGVVIHPGAIANRLEWGPTRHTIHFQREEKTHAVEATHVLINAGPKTYSQLVGESWKPSPTDEGSVVKINMLLRRLPKVKALGVTSEEAFAGSLHIDEGYEQMIESYVSAKAKEVPKPAPGDVYCHTLTDPSILSPTLQSQGYHTLTLFGLDMPYRLFEEDHDSKLSFVKQLYFDGLSRICEDDFIDCLALDANGNPCIEIKSPQDIEREVSLDWGNIFQNSLSWFFTDESEMVGRWGVETPLERVYLAGSSAMRGGAVSGIAGHNAAQCVMNSKR